LAQFVQKKTLLLILLALLILNLIVFAGSRFILLDSYLQIERQAVEENLQRLANAIQKDAETLGTLCADWAIWDDTYAYVVTQNPEYETSNLGDLTLVDLHLNGLLIFDARGNVVFSKGMDLASAQPLAVPKALLDYFQQRGELWPPQLKYPRQDGLLMLDGMPLLLSFRPIVTSKGQGPARGILVMTRWFNQAFVEELGTRTALEVKFRPLAGQGPDPVPAVQVEPPAEKADFIRGNVLIRDLSGAPAFQLSIRSERALFKQGQSTVAYFQSSFLLISLVVGICFYLILAVTRVRKAAAEKRFRYVFENATNGLLVFERADQLASINSAAKKLLAVGDQLEDAQQVCFSHPQLRELIETGLQGKVAGPVELVFAHPQQQTYLRAYMAPMLGEDGKRHGTIATLHDITREKELERLKSEFIASAAHELNTPLSIIVGYADLLQSGEYAGEEELAGFLAIINEKSHALGKIVDDLLQLGKIESGKELYLDVEPYDLSASLRRIVEVYEKKSPQHQFEVKLFDDDIVIVADRHRLGQVFDNLLSNAIKYSPRGGKITVSGSLIDGELLLCVADQGIGLTEEQVGKVFEKFYRVDNSSTAVRGLGLGLNVTRNIIEAHGGRIWLESEPGHGTRFYFTLPDISPAATEQAAYL
jgi:signal transduction histidine kinase